ncbi:MAG: V-type ATP synthase subunit E [Prolixibacteraceae bacterium]|nr:V-type ATP synthase subunit E [Prolixibacteraceae bacterium]MBN2649439.1 V-type ATP synthase subunit E [Prolixibacteraceae bacterium]
MQTKVQELTDKLYSEGVEKARKEADAIIKEAKEQASKIEKEAQKKAEKIEHDAKAEAEKLKQHVESELKMTVNQSVSALKQNLASLLTLKAIEPGVKELFSNTDFLKVLIEKIVKGWSDKGLMDISVVLSEKEQNEMEKFFQNQLADELNKGLEIEYSNGIKSGFKVGPADKSYQISFTDEDFTNFLKSYLRPKTNELLFKEEK